MDAIENESIKTDGDEQLLKKERKDGFYGKYGGLIIFVLPFAAMLLLLVRNYYGVLNQAEFLNSIIFSVMVFLPIGFSAALSVRTKGLDLSVPAMVMIASRILEGNDTLAIGLILALSVCMAIGAANAAAIHFLKLPAMLVTFISYMLASIVLDAIPRSRGSLELEPSYIMPVLLVVIAAIIAVYIAVVSSRKTKKPFLTQLLPVYAGSGIMTVLCVLASLFAGNMGLSSIYPPESTIMLLLIGVFLSITRFTRNKVLALALIIIPCFVIVSIDNTYGFWIAENPISYSIFLLLMFILIFYRGRAELLGQSIEKNYRRKGWIACLPVWLWLGINILLNDEILKKIITGAFPSMSIHNIQVIMFIKAELYKYIYIEFLLIAMGLAIAYVFMKPRELVKTKK